MRNCSWGAIVYRQTSVRSIGVSARLGRWLRRNWRTVARYSSPMVRSTSSGSTSGPPCRADLDAQPRYIGHRVEVVQVPLPFPEEDRELAGSERGRVGRSEIKDLLASRPEWDREIGNELTSPGPGRHDQAIGDDPVRVGQESRPVGLQVDPPHGAVFEHLGPFSPECAGQFDLDGHGAGRGESAGVGLEDDVGVVGDVEHGQCPMQLAAGRPAVRDPDGLQADGDLGHVIDPRRAERDSSRAEVEVLPGVGLQLLPGAEGVEHQPGVTRVSVRMPRDPRRAVRAAAVVAEARTAPARGWAPRAAQVIRGGRAHRTGAEDDVLGVEGVHGLVVSPGRQGRSTSEGAGFAVRILQDKVAHPGFPR